MKTYYVMDPESAKELEQPSRRNFGEEPFLEAATKLCKSTHDSWESAVEAARSSAPMVVTGYACESEEIDDDTATVSEHFRIRNLAAHVEGDAVVLRFTGVLSGELRIVNQHLAQRLRFHDLAWGWTTIDSIAGMFGDNSFSLQDVANALDEHLQPLDEEELLYLLTL